MSPNSFSALGDAERFRSDTRSYETGFRVGHNVSVGRYPTTQRQGPFRSVGPRLPDWAVILRSNRANRGAYPLVSARTEVALEGAWSTAPLQGQLNVSFLDHTGKESLVDSFGAGANKAELLRSACLRMPVASAEDGADLDNAVGEGHRVADLFCY